MLSSVTSALDALGSKVGLRELLVCQSKRQDLSLEGFSAFEPFLALDRLTKTSVPFIFFLVQEDVGLVKVVFVEHRQLYYKPVRLTSF